MRRSLALLIVTLGMTFFCASAAAQSTNPFIDDGRITESPFNFPFEITSVTSEVDKYGKPFLVLQADVSHDKLVNKLKNAYRTRALISERFNVMGYAWQTRQGEWSFQLRDNQNNTDIRIAVLEENGNTIIRIYGRQKGLISGRYRRIWAGFSPRKLDKYSIAIRAF